MAYSATEQDVLDSINKNGKGRPYEAMMAKALAAYCIKNDIQYRTVIDTKEDKYKGTDFRVYGMLDTWTSMSGILRLDFTSAFDKKDNMPLLWTPGREIQQITGHNLQFGVRTANKTAGFEDPVIVIGINASNNDDPDDDVDIELLEKQIMATTAKNAAAILSEAGQCMAAYGYLTEPRYVEWLGGELEKDDLASDLWIPDTSRLMPNVNGAKYMTCLRPNYIAVNGANAAKDILARYAASQPDGSKEQAGAMSAWREFDTAYPNPVLKPAISKTPWLDRLKATLARMEQDDRDAEKPFDGFSK